MTVIEIKDMGHFEEELKKAGDKLVVVDFFATWCGPCRVIAPKLSEMSATNTDVVFCKVDVDEAEDIAKAYNVEAMPTFKFFKNGKEIAKSQVIGANVENIKAAVMANK